MSPGRTTWLPRDAAEHDRELVVELGEEFGPAGPYVLCVLKDLAQQQRDGGQLRTGFRVLRTKAFVDDIDTVRAIVEHAAAIGALDDLAIDPDGRRFTCRVSGWEADQARGRAAIKKADHRSVDMSTPVVDMSTPGVDVSGCVPPTRDNQRGTEKTGSSLRSESARGRAPRRPIDPDEVPDDFPADLAPALDEAVPPLERVASAKGAIAVHRAGVARTIASRPRKQHAKAAADFETWWLHGSGQTKPLKDVVAAYRNWLDREPDMAAHTNGAAGQAPKRFANTGDFSRFDQVGAR